MKRLTGILGAASRMIWAFAAQGAEVTTARLTCGGTRFTAMTHSVHHYLIAQEMWALPAGARQARPVDLRESTFVLRRIVPGLAVVADEVGF